MWTNTYTTWKAVPEFPRIFPERDDSEVQARANGRRDVESEAKTLWWSLKISKFTFGGSTLPKTTFCAPYVARDFSIFLDMFRGSSRWCVCSCREALEKLDSFCHHLPFRDFHIFSHAFQHFFHLLSCVHVFPMSWEALLGLGSILWTLGQTYKAARCVLASSGCVKLVVCNLCNLILRITSSNTCFSQCADLCWIPWKRWKHGQHILEQSLAKSATSCNLCMDFFWTKSNDIE